MTQNQRRFVDVGNDIGYGKCFSRAGYPQQRLCGQSLADAIRELSNRFGLVARRFVSCC